MSFRRLLLNKCQEEFEKESEIANAEDEVTRIKMKRRMLGNIHFIGKKKSTKSQREQPGLTEILPSQVNCT